MVKKVIDIVPPREIKRKEVERLLPKSGILNFGASSPNPNRASRRKLTLILLVLTLIGIFSYAYFALPRAEIKIWPKTELLAAELEVIIDTKIQGEVLEFTKTIDQQFFSSDRFLREAKAEGIIQVYNNHSTNPQHLIALTRFRSACGKEFRTPIAINISGKRREGRNWVPGILDVEVVALRPGKEFNIEPTAFSIPGLRGTALFTTITGKSNKPMAGGKIEKVVRVSQKDLNLAEDILTKKAAEVCLDVLKTEQEISILKEAVEMNILESSIDVEVGAEVEEFIFQMKIRCRTIAFKTDALKKIASDFIADQFPENKLIVPESLMIDYSLENIDINEGRMVLSLDLTVALYSAIDQFILRKELTGKSLTEVYAFLENLPQIDKAYVDFWPFWKKSVSKNLDRIRIELLFNVEH